MMKNGQVNVNETTGIGLLANGTSGQWTVDVDESISESDRWFLQIEGPSVYFYFEIPSLSTIDDLSRFLDSRRNPAKFDMLAIGKNKGIPVQLLRDDEFDDRYFLAIGSADTPLVRYSLAGDDLNSVAIALEQAREDLRGS
jgi:hypothetical protein